MDTHHMVSTLYKVWRTANRPRPGAALWAARRTDAAPHHPPHEGEASDIGARRPTGTSSGGPALWGMGLLMGAAAMYLLDRENGERRRVLLTRRVEQYRDDVDRTIDREGERAKERLRGTARETMRRVRESMVSDDTIRREINTRVESVLPFEEAARIHVAVRRGRVTLDGDITEEHLNRVLGHVATVAGVRGLDNGLVVRASTARSQGTDVDNDSPNPDPSAR